jgi:hypothetical protein
MRIRAGHRSRRAHEVVDRGRAASRCRNRLLHRQQRSRHGLGPAIADDGYPEKLPRQLPTP